MKKITTLLMATLLILSLVHNGVSEIITPDKQAEIDAVSDINQEAWFLLGAALPLSCATGYLVGTMIDASPDTFLFTFTSPNDAQFFGCCIGGITGLSAWRIAFALNPATPAPERLLGKSPEYVSAYTDVYKRRARNSRLKSMVSGTVVGAGIAAFVSAIREQ